MKKIHLSKTMKIVAGAAILLLLIIIITAVRLRAPKEEPVEYGPYTVTEQVLADEVIVYLQNAAGIGEPVGAKTADEAVVTYRLILQSDVDLVNEDHTQAIQDRISAALMENIEADAALAEADIPALSAGVTEIVWKTILSQIESATDNVEESDYFYLAESMQQQIRELEERKMKVSIRAKINKDGNGKMTPEELLALLAGMNDEEIEALAKSLGLTHDELYQLLASEGTERGSGDKELEEKLEKLQKELEELMKKENSNNSNNSSTNNSSTASDGTNGRGGRNGTDGKDGQDGKDGKDGKAGQNGDSVFIRYAETATGDNMTEKPTGKTKYMGTYVGANASTNAADYTWTRYSDATITYSDGTLYITQ